MDMGFTRSLIDGSKNSYFLYASYIYKASDDINLQIGKADVILMDKYVS